MAAVMDGDLSLGSTATLDGQHLQTLKYLGRGSSATVSACSLTSPSAGKRVVAMKRIRTDIMHDPAEVKIFLEEVRLLRKLEHKYIVQFYGSQCAQPEAKRSSKQASKEELYFLQEYMAGGTMHGLTLRAMSSPAPTKMYSNADALRWALQLALALEYLHSLTPKVVHRDLKMENVLLSHTKPSLACAKLADFGLARELKGRLEEMSKFDNLSRLASDAEVLVMPSPARLEQMMSAPSGDLEQQLNAAVSRNCLDASPFGVQPRAVERPTQLPPTIEEHVHMTARTGSMGYMAPEVLQGKPYNEKADVFSFAIILYNLFHRNIPTVTLVLNGDEEDLEEYATNVAHGFRPPLSPHVPAEVVALIERCWKGMPELRPSMGEVVQILQAMQPPLPEPEELAAAEQEAGDNGCCTIM